MGQGITLEIVLRPLVRNVCFHAFPCLQASLTLGLFTHIPIHWDVWVRYVGYVGKRSRTVHIVSLPPPHFIASHPILRPAEPCNTATPPQPTSPHKTIVFHLFQSPFSEFPEFPENSRRVQVYPMLRRFCLAYPDTPKAHPCPLYVLRVSPPGPYAGHDPVCRRVWFPSTHIRAAGTWRVFMSL